jgi:hypothetical protein
MLMIPLIESNCGPHFDRAVTIAEAVLGLRFPAAPPAAT